jgi:hypothetical protein
LIPNVAHANWSAACCRCPFPLKVSCPIEGESGMIYLRHQVRAPVI